ncbi:MAG: ParB/RepB/Spo0J family partition protein, partial [Acidimicrobiales bacterium]
AKAILATPDRGFQESLAKKAAADGLSVREVEDAVRGRNEIAGQVVSGGTAGGTPRPPSGRAVRPAGLLELEDLLADHLDTTVKVEMGAKKGRVVVEFATLEDLERIYRAMTQPRSA